MDTALAITRPAGTSLRLRVLAALLATLLIATLAAPVGAAGSAALYILPTEAPLPAGARVLGALPVADALIVSAPEAPTGAVLADEQLGFHTLLDEGSDGTRLDSAVASIGAPEAWSTTRGDGAVVALIDTGIAPIPALEEAVVGEIDFTGTGGGDPYGHGTFLASLVAARSSVAPGVAPEAGVLSLKVGDDEGATDLLTVLHAMQWLDGPGRAAGVRIATLAFGIEADTDAAKILDRAGDKLAKSDVLLITSAGNDGPGNLTSPATSTGTFSVGALDDGGTADRDNDTVASFSGTGVDRAGNPQPDLWAPGVSVTGHIHADSHIATTHPEGVVEGQWFRGTGTSMSTAITAGVAALASSHRPDVGGSALAVALFNDARVLDAPDALTTIADAPSHPSEVRGGGNGNNDKGERGRSATAPGQARAGSEPVFSPDGVRWTGVRWTGVRWTGVRWTGVRWTGVRWTGAGWGDENWAGVRWTGVRWTGGWWSPEPHDSDFHFAGVRWTGVRWTGVRWTGVRWTGVRWTGVRWTGVRWTWLTDEGT